ncbi:hypothetical protein FQA39_LY19247 [Lamprigera yunnana]|nr:hypothetical protein FQA39_LY19247 [Lamprigera yunnana]
MCPEDRVQSVKRRARNALDALSVSVEDADAQTDAEQALFGEPGMPPPKEGWQRSRIVALFQERAAADEAQRLLQPQDFFAGCQVLGVREVAARARLGAADAVAVHPGRYHPILDRCPRQRFCPPPQPRAAFAWTQVWPLAPAPTPPRACACAGLRSAAPLAMILAACLTTAAARASWPLARPNSAPPISTRWTLTRPPSTQPTTTQRPTSGAGRKQAPWQPTPASGSPISSGVQAAQASSSLPPEARRQSKRVVAAPERSPCTAAPGKTEPGLARPHYDAENGRCRPPPTTQRKSPVCARRQAQGVLGQAVRRGHHAGLRLAAAGGLAAADCRHAARPLVASTRNCALRLRKSALATASSGDCRVDVQQVVIDSTSFNPVGARQFKLTVVLRNAADYAVAVPALELSLNDAAEKLVLRRVLSAADMQAPAQLPAQGEWTAVVAKWKWPRRARTWWATACWRSTLDGGSASSLLRAASRPAFVLNRIAESWN